MHITVPMSQIHAAGTFQNTGELLRDVYARYVRILLGAVLAHSSSSSRGLHSKRQRNNPN